jgi:predicted enzyme related to lactoylglutathione lyase
MAVGPVVQIHISVTDLARSVDFYTRVLGIPLLLQVPEQPMAFLTSGQVRLYLGVPERPEYTSRCLIYFQTDDLEAEYQRLVAAGVPAGEAPHLVYREGTEQVWMAGFTDPDGHHLVLTQRRPG